MTVTQVTVKYQEAVLEDARHESGQKAGGVDERGFELNLRETMPEWFSREDDEAFGDL